MATRIRLQRHGRKGYAFYHIVVADSRAPRDGKFIERLGYYNPNTNPATINLHFDRALYWVETGAQPTDTVRNILSDEGVMLMKHLDGGVRKGSFNEEDAKKKFEAWKANKDAKLEAKKTSIKSKADEESKKRMEEEIAKNKAKAEELAKKRAEIAEAEAKVKAEEEAAKKAEEAPAEEPKEETATEPEAEA